MLPRPRRRHRAVPMPCPTRGDVATPVRDVEVRPVASPAGVALAAWWACPACGGSHTRTLDVLDTVLLHAAGVRGSLDVHLGPQDAPEQVLAALAGIRDATPAGAARARRSEVSVLRGMRGGAW